MSEVNQSFDINNDNIELLGLAIKRAIERSVNLICYSRDAMMKPETSITEIPGMQLLFAKACLQHGLLGYLEWKHENTPSEQNSIIMNNVMIAACGKRVHDDTINGIAHTIDPEVLDMVRTRSRVKFNEIMGW
jgi:hypothetical protein